MAIFNYLYLVCCLTLMHFSKKKPIQFLVTLLNMMEPSINMESLSHVRFQLVFLMIHIYRPRQLIKTLTIYGMDGKILYALIW